MATYVNNLRLKEIATGDESGTWGASTNTNLELIGEALGFGTEAITTNADTHTSTVADASADEARALYLKYTGTLDSTCTITIGPNTMKRVHIIENATSGSQSIIIKQGSGATVTIANGQVKIVFLDGAGSGAAVTDALQDLAIPDLFVDDDLSLQSDGAIVNFGADSDITLTHVADTGLTITNTNTGDNKPVILQLKSEEDDVVADEVIASFEMAAGDSGGTDGATVAAGIHAIAEGTFAADANATKLVFTTGVSETAAASATAKMTLSSAGLLTIADDLIIKSGGTIGGAGDTDLLTLGSSILTVAGEVSMTTLDIGGTDVTATATELNYVDGVTSAIQTQLNTKTSTGKAIALALVFG